MEILIEESRTEPTIEADCRVTAGTWFSYCDQQTFTAPGGALQRVNFTIPGWAESHRTEM